MDGLPGLLQALKLRISPAGGLQNFPGDTEPEVSDGDANRLGDQGVVLAVQLRQRGDGFQVLQRLLRVPLTRLVEGGVHQPLCRLADRYKIRVGAVHEIGARAGAGSGITQGLAKFRERRLCGGELPGEAGPM